MPDPYHSAYEANDGRSFDRAADRDAHNDALELAIDDCAHLVAAADKARAELAAATDPEERYRLETSIQELDDGIAAAAECVDTAQVDTAQLIQLARHRLDADARRDARRLGDRTAAQNASA